MPRLELTRPRRREPEQRLVVDATTSFASTTRTLAQAHGSATTSMPAAFTSTRYGRRRPSWSRSARDRRGADTGRRRRRGASVGRAGREDRDAALERRGRRSAAARRAVRAALDDDVGDEVGDRCRGTGRASACAGDEDPPRPSRSAGRGAAAVEERRGRERSSAASARALGDVRDLPPPASPPPARRQPIVGTPARAATSRWSDAAWRRPREARAAPRRSAAPRRARAGRPTPPHRHDHEAPAAREQPREMRR